MRKIHSLKKSKVVLLTGASSGLGLAIAKRLIVNNDCMLILTARSTSNFRFKNELILNSDKVWLRDMDIIDHQQITSVITEINEKLGGVDVLINNAGISESSTVEDSDDSCRQRQLDVNYLAPFELITQILPMMRKKRCGQIINISSSGGFMAMPTMSAYSASKFALEAASESLWYEMKPWGIHVTLVIPGFINSLGYLNTSQTLHGKESSADSKSAYFEHYRGMRKLIERGMRGASATNKKIALKVSYLMEQSNPPLRVHITFQALLFYWVRKIFPPSVYSFLFYRALPNIQLWGKNDFQEQRTPLSHKIPGS